MSLMISENISRPALERTRINAAIDTIFYAISACALGELLVARSVKGVCAILMGSDPDELAADLAIRFPAANLIGNHAAIHDDLAKVIGFIDKPADGFYLPLDMRARCFSGASGRSFARLPWQALSRIPTSRIGSARSLQPVQSLAPAPPIRSHWLFLVTALFAAMVICGTTAGASSGSVK